MSFNTEDIEIILLLAKGNPGACTVVCKLFNYVEENEDKLQMIVNFINKILELDIVGYKLWSIYKNEANMDISQLLELDLIQFNDGYFYT